MAGLLDRVTSCQARMSQKAVTMLVYRLPPQSENCDRICELLADTRKDGDSLVAAS